MTTVFTWICPHCSHSQVATDANHRSEVWAPFVGGAAKDRVGTFSYMTRCLNAECSKITLVIAKHRAIAGQNGPALAGDALETWRLIPESSAKPQPDYIPAPLREDYLEACRIRDLSPKASATLARRCLQGMIRNFCGIAENTLDQEIKALKTAIDNEKAPRGVTHESVDAIDNVRKVGNIGAHMEKDIDLIVDIDTGEAQLLIELIETLFEEWYVARKVREDRFANLAALRATKDIQKKGSSSE